jgi:plastocyanin
MARRASTILGLSSALVLVLAACSGGGASSAAAPSAGGAAPSTAASEPAGGGAACAVSTETGTVAVTIKGFAFNPNAISAKVGEVVGFVNNDTTAHTATLDDGSCSTENIDAGASMSLSFSAAGTYPFHCKIHPNMTGTITVS